MKIKAEITPQVIKREDGYIHSVVPILKADIDVSLEEMELLRKHDKLTYDVLLNAVRKTASEIAKEVQIS